MKTGFKLRRLSALLLCLCMVLTSAAGIGSWDSTVYGADITDGDSGELFTSGASESANNGQTAVIDNGSGETTVSNSSGPTKNVNGREADPSTMDSYETELNLKSDSFSAGRLWADKTVLANGKADAGDQGEKWDADTNTLTLDSDTDGVEGEIELDEDFLHVYSLLGSSQQVTEAVESPVDLVIMLDMSGSMAQDLLQEDQDNHGNDPDDKKMLHLAHSRIQKVLDSINTAIDKLMIANKENRVAVVGYGATAATLMDLAHYKSVDASGVYLTVSDLTNYESPTPNERSSGAYTVTAKAWKWDPKKGEWEEKPISRSVRNNYRDNKDKQGKLTIEPDYYIGFHTDLQAGLYLGFDTLYEEYYNSKSVSYTYKALKTESDKTITMPRVPAMFVISDGGANYALKDPNNSATGDEWHEFPKELLNKNIDNYTSSWQKYRSEGDTNQGAGVILDTLMTASFMKSKVLNLYTTLLQDTEVSEDVKQNPEFVINTISVDTPEKSWQIPRVYATLDPTTYFNENPPALPKKDNKDQVWQQRDNVTTAYTSWNKWQNLGGSGYVDVDITVDLYDQQGNQYQAKGNVRIKDLAGTVDGVTKEDVIKNINYNTSFADIGSADLTNTLTESINAINKPTFIPVSGNNEMGVKDSATYMDPIGKYMEVKDVKKLLLFGTPYEIVKTGVYNYNFVSDYLKETGTLEFEKGWYQVDKEGKYKEKYEGEGEFPAEKKWTIDSEGNQWIYYLDGPTAREFVPTLPDDKTLDQLAPSEKEKFINTTYTFYRIDKEQSVRDTLQLNSAYETLMSQTDFTKLVKDGTINNKNYKQYPGVYKLSDIRIWVEDVGSYNDSLVQTDSLLTSANFDEALWVDVPSNAIPMRTINIKGERDTLDYTYNIYNGSTQGETPLRVFYTVGLKDDVLDKDDGVDLEKISASYLQTHKITEENKADRGGISEGNVEFFSNWYNKNKNYEDYIGASGNKTFGDPVVSFSPGSENRYYVFQRALPLYKKDSSAPDKLDALTAENVEKRVSENGYSLVTDAGDIKSTESYYIFLEYFTAPKDSGSEASKAVRLVERKGSEFGIKDAGKTAAGLCWLDKTTGKSVDYTDTVPDVTGDWVIATKAGSLRVGNMASSAQPKKQNPTYTAAVHYQPTISSSSDIGNAKDIVANIYLGNNGRLYTYDSELLVTKLVEPPMTHPEFTIDSEQKFDYQIYLDTELNETNAIVVKYVGGKYDEAKGEYTGGTWQRLVQEISVNLDSNDHLLDANGKPAKFISDGNEYYFKLPDTSGDDRFIVGKRDSGTTTDGNISEKYGIFKKYDSGTSPRTTFESVVGSYSVEGEMVKVGESSGTPETIELLKVTPSKDGTEFQAEGKYDYEISYVTEKVKFGLEDETKLFAAEGPNMTDVDGAFTESEKKDLEEAFKDKTEVAKRTGSFTLTHGYGLLFTGLGEDTVYRVTENLTSDQVNAGYSLKYVDQTMGDNAMKYAVLYPGEDAGDDGYEDSGVKVLDRQGNTTGITAYFDNEGYEYSVFGETDPKVEAVNYVNLSANKDKTETEINGEALKSDNTGVYPGVRVGDTITYAIEWANTTGENADVEIIDRLDPGVDFVSASILMPDETPVLTLGESEKPAEGKDSDGHDLIITYKEDTETVTKGEEEAKIPYNTVTWSLKEQPRDARGKVTLTVRVNNSAPEYWDYDNDGNADAPVRDDKVRNRATVRVADNTYTTNTVVNPVEPDKTEVEIKHSDRKETVGPEGQDLKKDSHGNDVTDSDGNKTFTAPEVFVGDEITYRIDWKNDDAKAEDIVIVDPLDPGVEFLKAAIIKPGEAPGEEDPYDPANNLYVILGDTEESKSESPDGKEYTITYKKDVKFDSNGRGEIPDGDFTFDFGNDSETTRNVVTWKLPQQGIGVTGTVLLTVKVTNKATPAGQVDNQASVKVGENDARRTSIIENPTPNAEKTETEINGTPLAPGKVTHDSENSLTDRGPKVGIGDQITYNITWENKSTDDHGELKDAKVVIVDPLDDGATFIEANLAGHTLKKDAEAKDGEGNYGINVEVTGTDEEKAQHLVTGSHIIISYTAKTHTVTWEFTAEKDTEGNVSLITQVNPLAADYWNDYVEDDPNEKTPDFLVRNRASVKVENSPTIYTRIVENPLEEEQVKSEEEIGDNPLSPQDIVVDSDGNMSAPMVFVDDIITYRISWINTKGEDAEVSIRDELDPGVDFEEAAILKEDGTEALALKSSDLDDGNRKEDGQKTITYTASNENGKSEVTWDLGEQKQGAKGQVLLKVKVNSKATPKGLVENQAEVSVNNVPEFTNKVENPTPDSKKTETTINGEPATKQGEDGDRVEFDKVRPGDEITYSISYENYQRSDDGTVIPATITITDELDEGVDFVRAVWKDLTLDSEDEDGTVTDQQGAKIAYTHTDGKRIVTWEFKEADGKPQDVELTVRVNKNAVKYWNEYDPKTHPDNDDNGLDFEVLNQASVKVGDNPAVKTEIMENPLEPDKIETEIEKGTDGTVEKVEDQPIPGGDGHTFEGPMVYPGDVITYEIYWKNDTGEEANIIITDTLDPNVEYESSDPEGTLSGKTVTWNLGPQAAEKEDKVTLKVRVKASASLAGEVKNQAVIKVENNPDVTTDPIVNPTPHTEKKEVSINGREVTGGTLDPNTNRVTCDEVKLNDKIGYEIYWENKSRDKGGNPVDGKITIKDTLDPGVDFVSAGFKGLDVVLDDDTATKTANEWSITAEIPSGEANLKAVEGEENDLKITYDIKEHQVVWEFTAQPTEDLSKPKSGYVTLVTKVNEKAIKSWDGYTYPPVPLGGEDGKDNDFKLLNQASVQVNDGPILKTDIIENPTSDEQKTELEVSGKPVDLIVEENGIVSGPFVQIEDTITYQIDWRNGTDKTQTVTIFDTLDPGVDPVEAGITGEEQTLKIVDKDASGKFLGVHCDIGNATVVYDPSVSNGQIRWELGEQEPGASGSVFLTVKVTERAIVSQSGNKVVNKAVVSIGGDEVETNEVDNPVPNPKKEEVSPGANESVAVGQIIDYTVSWENNSSQEAAVTIKDPLDDGVTFVSAGMLANDGVTELKFTQAGAEWTREITITGANGEEALKTGSKVTISYDASEHEVIWKFTANPNTYGKVTLKVQVNESAFEYWNDYESSETTESSEKEPRVLNRAEEWVNDAHFVTEIIPNPLEEKTELRPGAGTGVNVNDTLTYTIYWVNDGVDRDGNPAAGTVTIEDKLDPGVDFEEASFENNPSVVLSKGSTEVEDGNYEIQYDAANHVVTWILRNRRINEAGRVTLKVVVNENARWKWMPDDEELNDTQRDDKVVNRAEIQVQNKESRKTNVVENPVNPEKTETTPGKDKPVKTGDPVTYQVTWTNYTQSEADVIIEDQLDPGVDINFENGKVTGTSVYVYNAATKKYERSEELSECVTYIPEREDSTPERTLRWTLEKQKPGTTGYVEFTVTVKENAKEFWKDDYEAGPNPADPMDNQIWNRARVKVGNSGWFYTEHITNPVEEEPEKTETWPGAGETVDVGDEIVYEIEWTNYKTQPATVIVTDKLDPGVDFVSADPGGTYDQSTRTVTWNLGEQDIGASGKVILTVKVNDKAVREWQYDEKNYDSSDNETGSGKDYKVRNKAKVTVDNEAKYTNEVENPTGGPEKTETDPGAGELVGVGQEITYEIDWENDQDQAETVTITDKLDPGVDFVSAASDGVTLSAADGSVSRGDITITYNPENHEVTWKLGTKAVGDAGTVTLTVKVNDKAALDWDYNADYDSSDKTLGSDRDYEVRNKAKVTVGNISQETNEVENPVPDKEEMEPGEGETVKPDEKIFYKIHWKNAPDEEDLRDGKADVIITDPLDPNVELVSASFGNAVLTFNPDGTTTFDQGGESGVTIALTYDFETSRYVVTWTLKEREAGADGDVDLTVKVKDSAVEEGVVENQATVQVDNTSVQTRKLHNPTEPQKTETTPGDRKLVEVGDEITYEIDWRNYKDTAAEVVVTDKLDPGVDFVSAASDEVTLSAPNSSVNGNGISITYNTKEHTVTWNLGTQDVGISGKVILTVKVNDKAVLNWEYGKTYEETKPAPEPDGENNDYEVWNKAKVAVDNESSYTNEVENPVPDKEETTPGEGQTVKPDEEISYKIHWKNAPDETNPEEGKADVIITDPLDPNVELVSASFDGVTLKTEGEIASPAGDITISYKNHTVTWTLKERAAGDKGTVDLIVRVKDSALAKGKVENQATVQIGNDAVQTRKLENPTGGPEKKETEPGAGELVGVGKEITYEITWKNDKETEAEVTVTDKLDPGVDFVSAAGQGVTLSGTNPSVSDDGITITYDSEKHKVTWELGEQDAGASGTVTLKVKVNDKAALDWHYNTEYDSSNDTFGSGKDYEVRNKAEVTVGNDSQVTNEVENPVPDKEEMDPGEGKTVKPGDEIPYEIHWKNAPDEEDLREGKADVIIKDPLDPNVELVSASFGGVTLEAEGEIASPAGDIAISYKDHIVTWTLKNRDEGDEGIVDLKVRVKDSAVEEGAVENHADVKIGNTSAQTRKLYNPTEPEKTETTPGVGELVGVEDKITYAIDWKNYKDTAAKVVVTDKLDPGVDFVSAEYGEKDSRAELTVGEDNEENPIIEASSKDGKVKISYSKADHTVTWNLGEQEAKAFGTVTLTVKVNDKAALTWNYKTDSDYDSLDNEFGSGQDYEVRNKAEVAVDNVSTYTNEVENPVPDKEETKPGEGQTVKPGEEIFYEIHWKNAPDETDLEEGKADVIITDPLDPNVELVSASFGGVTLEAPEEEITSPTEDITISYKDHTVTWTLKNREAGEEGTVDLIVRVKDSAVEEGVVENQAKVQVGNTSAQTRKLENPTGGPEKKETDPGAGELVGVGKEITYEITWKNDKDKAAVVTVADKLDPGVDFVSAASQGVTLSGTDSRVSENGITITYDQTEHTVTWNLGEQATGASGTVTLTVKVNDKAALSWNYEGDYDSSDKDYEVRNKAEVTVDNESTYTNEVENPVPDKEETEPGEGQSVKPGDEIIYEIHWKNAPDETDLEEGKADVTITDPLDPNVELVSASFGGVTLGDEGEIASPAGDITISYKDHIVTWTLKNRDEGDEGTVDLKVRVKDSAAEEGAVENHAEVKIGNTSAQTRKLYNPTGGPEKTETTPGDGKLVNVGDPITYEITWKNYKDTTADVTITDRLDPGVDFVSADQSGSYDAGTHTVTWTLKDQAAGATGKVTLQVKTNEKAVRTWSYADPELKETTDYEVLNKASVQVGNDAAVDTNVVENPLPKKKEVTPGEDEFVGLGREIVYTIQWANNTPDDPATTDKIEGPAQVTIEDTLDPGVDFVSATSHGVTLSAADTTVKGNGISITYDPTDHKVTWDLGEQASGTSGEVYLTVKVNRNAFVRNEVTNGASVTVGGNNYTTNIVSNPTTNPQKVETAPGADEMVLPGENIVYHITWKNYKTEAANVVIRDTLDPNVKYVRSDFGGVYEEASRTVTWNLENQAAGAEGIVELEVEVLESAVEAGRVENEARVQVGNDEEVWTEKIENPTPNPKKKEIIPGVGEQVHVGEEITYEITWRNYRAEPAAVRIRDILDPGVDFVEASDGGVCTEGIVNWNLGVKQPGEEGAVTLKVRVNEKAVQKWSYKAPALDPTEEDHEVWNQASVKVGNDKAVETEIVENPLAEPAAAELQLPPVRKDVVSDTDVTETYTMKGGEFEFLFTPAAGNPEADPVKGPQTLTNSPDGSISLGSVTYTKAGVYKYTLVEVSGTVPGIIYDSTVYEITVRVTANADGTKLEAAVEVSGNSELPTDPFTDSITFENTYNPDKTGIALQGDKVLTGGKLTGGDFTFVLEPVSADVEEEAQPTVQTGNEGEPGGNGNQSEISGTGEPGGNEQAPGNQSEISGTGEPGGNEQAPGNGSEGEISGTGEPNGNEQAPENEANGGEAEVIGFSSGMGEPMDIFTQQPEGEELFGSSASQAANAASGTVLNCPVQARIHQHTAECFDAEGNNLCGKEDFVLHVHDINCYNEYGELDCTLPEIEPHVHDINCYDHYDVPVCGLEETGGHVHTDSCYAQTLICGIPEGHVHDDFCYATENVLSCGQEEYGHIHDPYSCYNEFGELICGQEEWGHVHTGSCYTPVTYLVCGIPEGHSHTDSCYQTVLACGQEEGTGHVHTLECYGCTPEYLTCTKPELKLEAHTHTQECYAVKELSAEHPEHTEECYDENGLLVCGGRICGKTELLAHQHDAGCFTAPAAQVMEISDGTGEADGNTGNDGTDPNGQNTADGITGNEGDDPNGQGTEGTGSGLTSEQDTEGNGSGSSGTAAIKALAPFKMPMPGGLTGETAPTLETHNTAAGIFQFGTITFDKAGTYVYKITEKSDAAPGNGIVYDGTAYRVTVKVTRTGEGLTAAIEKVEKVTIADGQEILEDAGAVVFENTYIPPELVIEKEHNKNGGEPNKELQEVVQGDTVTYYLTIKNVGAPGSTTAKNVTVTDTIPQGLILVEGSVSDGGTVNGREITWNLGDMEAAAEKTVSFQVRIPKVYEDTTWTNIGYLTYDDPHDPGEPADPEHPDKVRKPSNEVQEHEGVPHVVIRKLQSVNGGRKTTARLTVQGGDTVTYYLVITNDGTYPAEDVVVKDVIPEGLTLVAGSISDGGAVNGREITWSLGELPQGEDREVSFQVTVPGVEEYTMWTNMGRLSYGNNPENPEDGPDTEIPSNEVQIEEEPPRPTPTPDVTPRPIPTDRPDPTPTDRPSPSPSVTPSPSPSVSPSPSPSVSPSPSPSVSPSPSPSVSPSPSPSVSPSPSPSVSPSPSPSVSPSPSPSVSPSPSPSVSPSPSPSVSPSPSPSVTPAPTGPASLEVQKDLIYVVNDEESVPLYARSQTFYVALFEDPECTVRVSDVQALTYSGAASASVVFENLEPGKTYYVGEVDASGNVLEGNAGVLRGEIVGQGLEAGDDDVIFDVNFFNGNGATVTEEDGVTRVEFENDFYEIPDGFFLNGVLNITKIVLNPDGNPVGSDETFYAGIFADPEYTQLSPDVEYNIVPLSMEGSSELTVSVRVREYEAGDAFTLYVTEVDANGVPVDGSFGYQVTVENGELTFDEMSVVQGTVITNRTIGVTPSPTPVPERVTSTPTPAPVRHPGSSGGTRVVPTPIPNQGYLKDSPKTGDDTNIAMWVVLLAVAAAAAGAAVFVRKRSK